MPKYGRSSARIRTSAVGPVSSIRIGVSSTPSGRTGVRIAIGLTASTTIETEGSMKCVRANRAASGPEISATSPGPTSAAFRPARMSTSTSVSIHSSRMGAQIGAVISDSSMKSVMRCPWRWAGSTYRRSLPAAFSAGHKGRWYGNDSSASRWRYGISELFDREARAGTDDLEDIGDLADLVQHRRDVRVLSVPFEVDQEVILAQ